MLRVAASRVGPLALRLREGAKSILRGGSVNDTSPELLEIEQVLKIELLPIQRISGRFK